jgi:hypothetical protein
MALRENAGRARHAQRHLRPPAAQRHPTARALRAGFHCRADVAPHHRHPRADGCAVDFGKLVRDRIVESIKLAGSSRCRSPRPGGGRKAAGRQPTAGLPVADKIVNDYISPVAVAGGSRSPRIRRMRRCATKC